MMTTEAQDEILFEQIRAKQVGTTAKRTTRTLPPGTLSETLARIDVDALDARARDEDRRQAKADAEARRQAVFAAWNSSGVGRRFLPSRLDNYRADTPEHAAALAICREVVEGLRQGSGVLLIGEPEGGKTHLLCGILFEAIVRGMTGRYITVEDFYIGLRDRMDEGLSEMGFIDRFASPDVLALDDLYCLAAAKSAHEESYQYRMLWTLLDRRYRDMKATITSTNKPLKEFKEMLDERTRRRLEAKIVRVPKRVTK